MEGNVREECRRRPAEGEAGVVGEAVEREGGDRCSGEASSAMSAAEAGRNSSEAKPWYRAIARMA
jgi:hypothetical protein